LSKPTSRAHLVDIDQFEHEQMEVQPEPQQLLRLPADCSIGGIRIVYDLICKALSGQQKLELDCSGVDKVDVTSVQLLLSTAKTARHLGNRVSLTAVPEVLRSVIRRAGVSSRAMPDSHSAQASEIK
jgi:ABC-type transporter Mla MlaB component